MKNKNLLAMVAVAALAGPMAAHAVPFTITAAHFTSGPGYGLEFNEDDGTLLDVRFFVLHTGEPHPHVHVVVKAVSERGERLNIRKDTLRRWRAEFAWHLRALGVPANATERAARGSNRASQLDGIYRATQRGESTHMDERVSEVADALANGRSLRQSGKAKLIETQLHVVQGWLRVSELLSHQGESGLARHVREFVAAFPPSHTDRDLFAEQLRQQRAR